MKRTRYQFSFVVGLFFLGTLILSCCNNAGTPHTTNTILIQPTIPLPTNIISKTITPTRRPTYTPTITSTVTPTLDITSLGEPPEPFPAQSLKPKYNNMDFFVYQRILHGRPVTVAWEKIADIPESTRIRISDLYFQAFLDWWNIFKGFAYDSYTVVLKKSGNNTGETSVGYEATASDYANDYEKSLKERIGHEVFHAWVSNHASVCDKQEKQFDDGLWFREGFTQYYGDRWTGKAYFNDWIEEHYQIYMDEIMGTKFDVPIFDMPEIAQNLGESFSGLNRVYRLNVYWKGALIAYLMDERLQKSGMSTDTLLKYLYDNYGLKKKCFTTQDMLQSLNLITGDDWAEFFNSYIYGIVQLPLNGNFRYFFH